MNKTPRAITTYKLTQNCEQRSISQILECPRCIRPSVVLAMTDSHSRTFDHVLMSTNEDLWYILCKFPYLNFKFWRQSLTINLFSASHIGPMHWIEINNEKIIIITKHKRMSTWPLPRLIPIYTRIHSEGMRFAKARDNMTGDLTTTRV